MQILARTSSIFRPPHFLPSAVRFAFFIADLEFDVDSEETYAFFLPNLANALFEIGYGHNYSCCAERAYRRDDVAFLRVLGLRRIYPQLLPHTYVGCISTVV